MSANIRPPDVTSKKINVSKKIYETNRPNLLQARPLKLLLAEFDGGFFKMFSKNLQDLDLFNRQASNYCVSLEPIVTL